MALYHLDNFQMGLLGSAYGLLGLFSYALGGYLADRFAPKKLLIFSLVATGCWGLLHLYFTSLKALMIIYGLWGYYFTFYFLAFFDENHTYFS